MVWVWGSGHVLWCPADGVGNIPGLSLRLDDVEDEEALLNNASFAKEFGA